MSVLIILPIMFFIRYILQILALSIPAPTGLLNPSMVSGALFGRFIGESLNMLLPGYVSSPAAYAAVGAASHSASITQTVSAGIILIELSGQFTLLFPVLGAAVIAAGISRFWSESIYEAMLRVRNLPYLPDLDRISGDIPAGTIMERIAENSYLERVTTLRKVRRALKYAKESTEDFAYYSIPIVDNRTNLTLLFEASYVALRALLRAIELENRAYRRFGHNWGENGSLQKSAHSSSSPPSKSLQSTAHTHRGKSLDHSTKSSYEFTQTFTSLMGSAYDPKRMKSLALGYLDDDDGDDNGELVDLAELLQGYLMASPVQFSTSTPLSHVHVFFATLRLPNAYVSDRGRLCGVIKRSHLSDVIRG